MKQKTRLINGQRVYICTYKNCQKPVLGKSKACREHYAKVYHLTPVMMKPTWFSKLIDEIVDMFSWMFK